MRFILALLLTASGVACLSAGTPFSNYQQPTLLAVRIGLNGNSLNLGGANVITGVNIVPFQLQSSWVSGAPITASPTGANAFTLSSTATSEGALSISPNNRFLGLGGYRTGTNASGTDRVIGRVDLNSVSFTTSIDINTTTAIPNAEGYIGNNIRGAVWNDAGSQYWSAGNGNTASGGTRTGALSSTSGSVQVSTSVTNTRTTNIFNGQLYTSSASGTFLGVSTVGTGLPTTSGQTTALFVNAGASSSSYGFSISPDSLTAFVADDRANVNGGIQKWTRPDTASAFTLVATFGTGVANIGARGLSVDYLPPNPVIYASTAEASNNRLITFTDVAGVQTGLTTIASSGTNDIFRSVAFTPVPEPSVLLALGLVALVTRRGVRSRSCR